MYIILVYYPCMRVIYNRYAEVLTFRLPHVMWSEKPHLFERTRGVLLQSPFRESLGKK